MQGRSHPTLLTKTVGANDIRARKREPRGFRPDERRHTAVRAVTDNDEAVHGEKSVGVTREMEAQKSSFC